MKMMKKINSLYKKYKEIINYLIFGVLTTVISLAVYYALVYTILNPLNGYNVTDCQYIILDEAGCNICIYNTAVQD